MRTRFVVMVSGKAGAGKSTFAKYIQEQAVANGYRCVKVAFADRLKDIAYDHFGWDGNKDEDGRRLLQNLGTAGREYNKNLWVNYVKEEIMNFLAFREKIIYVIDDCRYLNEITFMDNNPNLGVVKIHISRPDNPHAMRGINSEHSSENDLNNYDGFDRMFINNGSRENLKNLAHDVMMDIMAGVLGDAK